MSTAAIYCDFGEIVNGLVPFVLGGFLAGCVVAVCGYGVYALVRVLHIAAT